MLVLRKPSASTIQDFLAAQASLDLTYTAVGATATEPPPGYVVDHTRIKLGDGEPVFRAAKVALEKWEHFNLGWVEAWPVPIKVGEVVAVQARLLGIWSLNACRIVFVTDEEDTFGFAYGTLPDHAESGEERFLIEWDQESGEVWYDIMAFSRPRHFLARLGYPLVRQYQKQFARDSAAAMQRGVAKNP